MPGDLSHEVLKPETVDKPYQTQAEPRKNLHKSNFLASIARARSSIISRLTSKPAREVSESVGTPIKAKTANEIQGRTIRRKGINSRGEKVEWDEILPTVEEQLAKMPIDDPEAYFDWLKNFHGTEYALAIQDIGEAPPAEYDYSDIRIDEVKEILDAVKKQRKDDPEGQREVLSELNPAQIVSFTPGERLLTAKEATEAFLKRKQERSEQFAQFPAFREIATPQESKVRFVHATASENTAQEIMQTGLHAHEPYQGLSGVAVGLGKNLEDNLQHLANTHRGHEYGIVIALPQPTEQVIDEMRGVYYPGFGRLPYDGLFVEELQNKIELHGAGIDYSHVVPAEFIEGYLDQTNGSFIQNPNYWENVLQRDQQTNGWTEDQLAKARQEKLASFEKRALTKIAQEKADIKERENTPFSRSKKDSVSVQVPLASPEKSDVDVW